MFQLHAQMGRESLVARRFEVVSRQMPSHLCICEESNYLSSSYLDTLHSTLCQLIAGHMSSGPELRISFQRAVVPVLFFLKHKTFVWICQIYAFLKIMSHISKVYSPVKRLPISSCSYCLQMAGHVYFSMMIHVENLCESDTVHSLNDSYQFTFPNRCT